jgi:adenine-specific DNA-methyltransferase
MNEIICGDAFSLIKEVEDGSVDLILSSPPYGIGKSYETRFATIGDYAEAMLPILADLVRVIKPGGIIAWQVGQRIESDDVINLSEVYLPEFRRLGMKLVNRLIWEFHDNKPFAGTHYRRLTTSHEEVLILHKPGNEYTFNLDTVRVPQTYPTKVCYRSSRRGVITCNPKGKNPGDVWSIHTLHFNSPEKLDHPAQYPEDLCEGLIGLLTNPGDVVADPFAGVGTTLFVAKRMGRKFLGFEKDRHYCDEAELRLRGFDPKGQMHMFLSEGEKNEEKESR